MAQLLDQPVTSFVVVPLATNARLVAQLRGTSMGEERATKLVAQLVTSFVVAPHAANTQRVTQLGPNYGAQLVGQRVAQLVSKLVVAS